MAIVTKKIGPISAYAIAKEEGYTGTKEQFAQEIGNAAANAQIASTSASAAESSATSAASSASQAMSTTPAGYNSMMDDIAAEYSASATYAVGDYCRYNSKIYTCTTAIATAEAFDSTKWQEVVIGNEMGGLKRDIVMAQSAQPSSEYNRIWIPTSEQTEVQVPTYDEFNQLSEDIYDSVISKNMIGPEPGVLYPVKLKTGDVITVSTSDGQTGDFMRLNTYDETGTYLGYYNITHSPTITYRTVTLEKDVYYLAWTPATSSTTVTGTPMVERGSVKTEFVPWFGGIDVLKTDVGNLIRRLSELCYIPVERGGLNGGTPVSSTVYVRTKGYIQANAGDTLKIRPVGFNIKNCTLYFYGGANEASYSGYESLYTISDGTEKGYTFTTAGFFRFRCTKNDSETITDADIAAFDGSFEFNHNFESSNLDPDKSVMNLDYDSIKTAMSGCVNFAVQTDTHMSLYKNFSLAGATHNPSDFGVFKCILRSMNKLGVDGVFNLGDIVRGFEFDQDYETRNSLDAIMKSYADTVETKKCFVVGNHDDGDLFYYNLSYNDKQSVANVLYPNEQFNRLTKYGSINSYLKNYYYCDINGIRVIVLYQKDVDYSIAVPQTETFAISAEQISWLTDTALDTNLPVLILTHAALVTDLYSHSGVGFADTLTALTNFVSGGGTLIACLSGHSHVQQDAKINGINHIGFDNGYRFFELVSIDLTSRTISCKVINNSDIQDRNFTY